MSFDDDEDMNEIIFNNEPLYESKFEGNHCAGNDVDFIDDFL